MAENETHVLYKAIADFTALSRSVRAARKNVAELRKEEALLNSQSVAGSAAATVAKVKQTKALKEQATAQTAVTTATKDNIKETSSAQKVMDSLAHTIKKTAQEGSKLKDVQQAGSRATRNWSKDFKSMADVVGRQVSPRLAVLQKRLDHLRNWRPRLMPPFIALVPIIGAVLALINPLVAGLGAVGIAAFGFAASLGSIGGAALAAIPGLAALISTIFALKTAFAGIGSVFKAAKTLRDASNGGGGGGSAKSELSRTEQLRRAQEDYRRAVEDVTFAEEDLNDARKEALRRVEALRKAVANASVTEAGAAANLQTALENYANVLADPGSTKGDKMQALVALQEAQIALNDTRDENIQNVEELTKAEADGIDGDKQVILAKRRLTDAIDAQRDAELALINVQKNANASAGGGAAAAAEFERLLNKLSPSAKAFVLTLLSMRDAWEAVQRSVQERFFSEVVDDIGSLTKLFPSLNSLLGDTAGALGRVISRGLQLITSSKWIRDLNLLGKQNVPIIENVGDGLLFLLDAFKDLALAVGPFMTDLSEGFKKGSDNFRNLIADARESGSLADWLDKVLGRMQQWWRIVKNIGATLFNYGAATENFGKWLTDGFENVTEGWLKASEDARKAGSPFQTYLEDIKPLLSEVKGLFSDFFSWFGRESSDPQNIATFTDIIAAIRDDLGPALGKVFDILTESGVGQDFVNALTSIVDMIGTLLENGGIDGIKAFFGTISFIFDAFKEFADTVPEPLLSLLATVFGTLAALTFTGLSSVLALLTTFFQIQGLRKLFEGLSNIKGSGSGGKGLIDTIKGILGIGGAAAAGTAGTAAEGGGIAATVGGVLKNVIKGVGKGGIIGAVLGIGTGLGADAIRNANQGTAGDSGSAARVGANTLEGAGTGAGIGALIGGILGSIVPVLGNAAGAAIGGGAGALIGGGIGLGTSDGADRDRWWSDMMAMFEGFFTEDLPNWFNSVVVGFQKWLTVDLPAWLASVANGFVKWLTVDLPYNIGLAAGTFVRWLTVDLPAAIGTVAGIFWKWLTVDLPLAIGTVAGIFWKWLTVDLPAAVSAAAAAVWKWLSVDVPAAVSKAAQAFWKWLTVDVPAGVVTAANAFWKWLTVDLPAGIKTAADAFWRMLTVDIPNNIKTAVTNIVNGVKTAFDNFFSGFLKGLTGQYNGGPVRRAGGGEVPGVRSNSDTVPAMLTPGEFVVRKAIVNRVGMENLQRFNSGVLSYSQMLQQGMASQPTSSKDKTSGVSFFDGGGLVPSFDGFSSQRPPSWPDGGAAGTTGGDDNSMTFGDIHIHTRAVAPAPSTMARETRKLAYLGGR